MSLIHKVVGSFGALAAVTTLAESPAPATAQPAIGAFVPLLLMFGIFYFLIIRPQQKKAKLHQQFVSELKRGDMVVTAAGIVGTIKNLSEKFVTLEIDEGVCMKVLRGQVSESANNLKEEPKPKTT